MIASQFSKVFWMLASVMLLCSLAVAQTPPDSRSHETPQLPQPRELLIEVDLQINEGAASTKERSVRLGFTAKEKSNNVTIGDVTASVTHYRVLESPNLLSVKISEEPWISIQGRPPLFLLALRNGKGERYGERRVMFQVKTDALTSNTVSDTIVLEPVFKEYKVSPLQAVPFTHPLIQYANSQGFGFSRSFYETCQGADCPGTLQANDSIATGVALVHNQGARKHSDTVQTPAPVTCVTKAEYQLFFDRSPNPFWRIKSVDVSGAHVIPHGVNRFLAKTTHENRDGACLPPAQISIGEVVVEGPEVDDFIDPAHPWKNAFVRQP